MPACIRMCVYVTIDMAGHARTVSGAINVALGHFLIN